MIFSQLKKNNIKKFKLCNSYLVIKDKLSIKLNYFLHKNSYYSTTLGDNKKLFEKYGSYSNYLIKQENEERELKLKKETIIKYLRKLKMREINMSRAPTLYEGPIYLNYWIRKRRSGSRK